MSDSFRPHEVQHTGLPCPSLTLRVFSNSCSFSRWCHPTISFSATPFPLCLQSFPASESFSVNQLCIRWPKCQSFSFSISPSKEYSGLISFRMTGFISFKSKRFSRVFQAPQFKNISTSVLSLLYGPILTSVMTTGKIIALTIWTIGKVIYLLFSTLSRFVIAFLPGMRVF